MYDSNLGRFLARDPFQFGAGAADRYAYAHDTPANSFDPLGLEDFSDWQSRDDVSLEIQLTTFDIAINDDPPLDKVTKENVEHLLEIAERHADKDIAGIAKSILASSPARKLFLENARQNLTPVKDPPNPFVNPFLPCRTDRVMRLIEDLKSDSFEKRTKAAEELRKYDRSIVPFLREYVGEEKPTLELSQRLEKIADSIEARYVPTKSQQAMLDVLASIGPGDKEARKILESVAGGWSESEVTQQAREALKKK